MKTLTLRIKRNFFLDILCGKKKIETREVKPTTVTRLVYFVCNGLKYKRQTDIPQNNKPVFIEPVHYDRLLLINGYQQNAPRLTVEVNGAEFYIITDDNDNEVTYMQNGKEHLLCYVDYHLGNIISTENLKTKE